MLYNKVILVLLIRRLYIRFLEEEKSAFLIGCLFRDNYRILPLRSILGKSGSLANCLGV